MSRASLCLCLAAAPSLAFAYATGAVRGVVASRAALSMGLFDGVKDAFGGDKPIVAADRVTPFDRWMGLDKTLVDAEEAFDESVAYIDPNDPTNCAHLDTQRAPCKTGK